MPRGKAGTPVTLRESRLIAEYLAAKHPNARVILQPRLGAVAPQGAPPNASASELRMLGVWRRYPDAVVIYPTRVIIIEAALKPDPGKLALLELYARLFPLTTEFEEYRHLPVDTLLVWAIEDAVISQMARERGIRVDVFQPPWVVEWLDSLRWRDRRAPATTA